MRSRPGRGSDAQKGGRPAHERPGAADAPPRESGRDGGGGTWSVTGGGLWRGWPEPRRYGRARKRAPPGNACRAGGRTQLEHGERGLVRHRILRRRKNPYVSFERGRSALFPFARRLGQLRRTTVSLSGILLAFLVAMGATTLASCEGSLDAGGSGSEIPAIAIVVIDQSPSSQIVGAKEWRIWRISNENGEPRLVLVAVLRDSTELLRLPQTAGYYLAEGWTEPSGADTDTVPSVVGVKSAFQTSAIESCMQPIDRIPQGDTARIALCRDASIAPSAAFTDRKADYLVVFEMAAAIVPLVPQRVVLSGDPATRLRPTHWRLWAVDTVAGDSMDLSFAGNYFEKMPGGGMTELPLMQPGRRWLIEAWRVDPTAGLPAPSTTIPLAARIDASAYSGCAARLERSRWDMADTIALESCEDAARLSPSSRVPGSRVPDAVAVFSGDQIASPQVLIAPAQRASVASGSITARRAR